MKIVYFTDPHGRRADYWNVLHYAVKNKIKTIVCGGDLFPGNFESWDDLYRIQKRFVTNFIPSFLEECRKHNIHFITIYGNDDLAAVEPYFNEVCNKYEICHNISRKKIVINTWEFIGFDLISDIPFLLKDRVRKDLKTSNNPKTSQGVFSHYSGKFEKVLWQKLYAELPSLEEEMDSLPDFKNPEKSVFISHQPPGGTKIATLNHRDLGSQSIRNYILTHKPRLSLHGHIHETKIWKDYLGETICIQPGSIDKTVLTEITLKTMQIRKIIVYEKRYADEK